MKRLFMTATLVLCLFLGAPSLAADGVDTGDNGHVWILLHNTYKRLLVRGVLNGMDTGYMLYVSTLDIGEECRPEAHNRIKESFDTYVRTLDVKPLVDFVDTFYADESNRDLPLGKAVFLGIKYLNGE